MNLDVSWTHELSHPLFCLCEIWMKWTIRKRILRDVAELKVHLNLIQDESKLWKWKVNVTSQDLLLGFHLILDWRATRGRVTGDWGWLRAGFIGRRCRISVQGCLIMEGTVVNLVMTMALLSEGENDNFIVWNCLPLFNYCIYFNTFEASHTMTRIKQLMFEWFLSCWICFTMFHVLSIRTNASLVAAISTATSILWQLHYICKTSEWNQP